MFNGHLTDTTKNGKRIVNTANIYINFESLYNCIRNTHVEKYLRVANKKEVNEIYRNMISNFINIVAHYRNYFSKSKIKTNIFLYYNNIPQSRVEYNNTALVKGYREHFFKSLTDLDRTLSILSFGSLFDFMKILQSISKNVYMVGTDSVESSLVPMIIIWKTNIRRMWISLYLKTPMITVYQL